jgi:hypothetical protein
LGQANVPECAVGILFLSFILFTGVVFLALAVTLVYANFAYIHFGGSWFLVGFARLYCLTAQA